MKMMLRPLSPSNSPKQTTVAHQKSASSTTSAFSSMIPRSGDFDHHLALQQQQAEVLFHFHSVAFLYQKKEKTWKELGEGATKFCFDRETSSIIISRNVNGENVVCHRVSLTTKIQNQVSTSQSWVFRAVHCTSGSHDVLCLQLPEEPAKFVSTYESHRVRCMQILENDTVKPTLIRSNSSSSSCTAHSTERNCENEVNIGSDLSKGLRSIPLRTTDPQAASVAVTSLTSPEQTATMRRRLSTVGTEFSIDGYAPGARNEQAVITSPTQKSPIRPAASGSAKTLRQTNAGPTQVTFSGISVKGHAPYNPDKQNQDSVIMHQLPTGEILLSVFDGHGEEGKTVSQHFKNRIPKFLANSKLFPQDEKTGQALKDALEKVEKEIVDDVRVDTTLSGTTGVVSVIRGQKLYVANVGDSRAIFGVRDLHSENKAFFAKEVTIDHKPDHPEEKKRIQEVGGRVFAVRFDDGIDGPARVWLSYADLPGLAMSRSLGDTIAKEAGVVSHPDLFEYDLTAEHKFLIIASDGLWEFMSSQEVVDIVAKHANSTAPDPEAAIEELVEESARRWRMNEPVIDDTSIIVAFFQ